MLSCCACSATVHALTLGCVQCKHDDNFASLRRPDDGNTAAIIANPKTQDFQVEHVISSAVSLCHPARLGVPLQPALRPVAYRPWQQRTAASDSGADHLIALSSWYPLTFWFLVQVFEVSDVVLLDPSAETGAANRRRLGAVQAGKSPGFEDMQGLLHLIMTMLEVCASNP